MTQTIQTQNHWRKETPNGVFTILTFQPRFCSSCGGYISARARSSRSTNSMIVQCKHCTCRENGWVASLLKKSLSPLYYTQDAAQETESQHKEWWMKKATIHIEE